MYRNEKASFAFVHYAFADAAKAALTAINNSAMSIKVEAYKAREEVERSRAAVQLEAEQLAQTMSHMVSRVVEFNGVFLIMLVSGYKVI